MIEVADRYVRDATDYVANLGLRIANQELNSKLHALASAELAIVSRQLEQLEPDESKKAELKAVHRQMLSKVANCPIVPSEQMPAREELMRLAP